MSSLMGSSTLPFLLRSTLDKTRAFSDSKYLFSITHSKLSNYANFCIEKKFQTTAVAAI